MRKLKFRFYTDHYSDCIGDGTKKVYEKYPEDIGIDNLMSGDYSETNEVRCYCDECKPVVCQYTGLSDKNGKEIYEGDIVLYADTESDYADVGIGEVKVAEQPMNSFYPVKFIEGEFGIKVTGGEVLEPSWYSLAKIMFNEELKLEVIGNIYENKDLLT